jgi:hypothetical protein
MLLANTMNLRASGREPSDWGIRLEPFELRHSGG